MSLVRFLFRACVFSLSVLAAACSSQIGPDDHLDLKAVLAPGQSVGAGSLVVRFVTVSADSRCPADAMCIVPGEASVVIAGTTESGREQQRTVRTSEGGRSAVLHDRVTVTLVELAPYPFSSRSIEPGDYRATLRITGR